MSSDVYDAAVLMERGMEDNESVALSDQEIERIVAALKQVRVRPNARFSATELAKGLGMAVSKPRGLGGWSLRLLRPRMLRLDARYGGRVLLWAESSTGATICIKFPRKALDALIEDLTAIRRGFSDGNIVYEGTGHRSQCCKCGKAVDDATCWCDACRQAMYELKLSESEEQEVSDA